VSTLIAVDTIVVGIAAQGRVASRSLTTI